MSTKSTVWPYILQVYLEVSVVENKKVKMASMTEWLEPYLVPEAILIILTFPVKLLHATLTTMSNQW